MIDPTNDPKQSHNRPLSEISHLFLSSLREQAGGPDRARPVRIPPGGKPLAQPRLSSDLTDAVDSDIESSSTPSTRKRVTAIVGAHFGAGSMNESVMAFSASLAGEGSRVGILWLDASEFRIQLVECDSDVPAAEPEVSGLFDDRQMTDGLLELNHDVDRWLLVVADPRRPEARTLLARCDDWTMLGTCDHDGIVGGYRTLKGLAEGGTRSPLSIALIDAADDELARRSFAKLAAVCRQFLDWDVTFEPLANDVDHAEAHTVLWCRGHHDKGQLATAPQWRVAQAFLELTPDAEADRAHFGDEAAFAADIDGEALSIGRDDNNNDTTTNDTTQETQMIDNTTFNDSPARANQPMSIPPIARPMRAARQTVSNAPVEMAGPAMSMPMPTMSIAPTFTNAPVDESGDVIELPDGVSILSAILRGGSQLLATPIAPPMCPGATVAVGRDRGLVLVAQAGAGLVGMDSIAAAVRWLDDSKQLIAMAMPQLSIDGAAPTQVQLLIDHADRTAEGLRPLLGNSRITIRSYRKVRWGGRNGLLLDAA